MADNAGLFFSILIIFLIIGALYLKFSKFIKKKTPKKNTAKANDKEYIHPRKRFKQVKITLELSWKFLTDITESVMFKFSKVDQMAVLKLGTNLAIAGMIYQHVLELGVRNRAMAENVSVEQSVTGIKRDGGGR